MAGVQQPRIARWFVDHEGQRLGPFSLGQIKDELKAGRISAESVVIPGGETAVAATPNGRNSTVKRLLDSYNDPAESLFETLRAAKDKRNNIRKAEQTADYSMAQAKHSDWTSWPIVTWARKVPDQAWMITGLVVVMVVLVWGSLAFMKQSGRMLATEKEETPAARKTVAAPAPAPTTRPLLVPRTAPPPAPIAKRPTPARPAPVTRRVEDPRRDPRDDARREDERREEERLAEERSRYDGGRDDRKEGVPIDRDIASPNERGAPGDRITNPKGKPGHEPDPNGPNGVNGGYSPEEPNSEPR